MSDILADLTVVLTEPIWLSRFLPLMTRSLGTSGTTADLVDLVKTAAADIVKSFESVEVEREMVVVRVKDPYRFRSVIPPLSGPALGQVD